MALQSGAVDLADDLDPDSIQMAKGRIANFKVIERPSVNVGYLAMNTKKPILNNKLVRQAIGHAIDKETIIKTIFRAWPFRPRIPFRRASGAITTRSSITITVFRRPKIFWPRRVIPKGSTSSSGPCPFRGPICPSR